MADNQVDGGQTDGTETVANGNTSSQSGVQHPSPDVAKLQEAFDAQIKTLEARINGLQGKKDTEISGLKRQIAEYKELEERLGPEGALDALETRQAIKEMSEIVHSLKNPAPAQSPGTGTSGAMDAAKAIEELAARGLDVNDTGFLDLLRNGLTQDNFNSYIVQKTRPAPAASAAGVTVEPGKGTQKTSNSELREQYISDMKDARGNGPLLRRIKKQYADAGVEVDKIAWT